MKHVILGNGPAGVIAAETIRKLRAEDDILVVGDEPEPPYSRMAIPYLLMGNIEQYTGIPVITSGTTTSIDPNFSRPYTDEYSLRRGPRADGQRED